MYTRVPTAEGGAADDVSSNKRSISRVALALSLLAGVGILALSTKNGAVPEQRKSQLSSSIDSATMRAKKSVKYGELSTADVEALFDNFIAKFEKPYATDLTVKAKRFLTFKANLLDIVRNERKKKLASSQLA